MLTGRPGAIGFLSGFPEKFKWNDKHAKALSVLFGLVLMVNLVRLSDGFEVAVFGSLEISQSLMDEDLMNDEV